MKRIGFVGFESSDIALYLARILRSREDNVVVVDHTRKLSLMRTAGIPNELTEKNGIYRDIEVFTSKAACRFRDDAVVVDYFGYYTELEQIEACDIVIFVTDMVVYNAQLLKGTRCREDAEKYLILRDAIPLKYKERYLQNETGMDIPEENVFVIPYDERDYRSRCYLCIDKKHLLSSLSPTMRKTLLALYTNIEKMELKRKDEALLLKNA